MLKYNAADADEFFFPSEQKILPDPEEIQEQLDDLANLEYEAYKENKNEW